jgi:hypothetical protein
MIGTIQLLQVGGVQSQYITDVVDQEALNEIRKGSNSNILDLQNPFEEDIVLFKSINPFEIVHVVIPGGGDSCKKRAQSHTDRSEVKEMHTSKVVAAYIHILAKDYATKTRPPRKLVALCLINPYLLSKKIIAIEILLDVGTAEEELENGENLHSLSVLALIRDKAAFCISKYVTVYSFSPLD